MALKFANRVREISSSTGTGSVTLGGVYATNYQSFSQGIGDGNSTYYAIVGQTTGEWEVGIGTYTLSTNVLSRTTVIESSNSNSLVNFSSGVKDVFCTSPAQYTNRVTAPVTVASASTVGIGGYYSNLLTITGTATITSLGTAPAGTKRDVKFSGSLTLTYNATSLILPGAANIQTSANDSATFISLGSGNWFCLNYNRGDGSSVGTTSASIIAALGYTPASAGANSNITSMSGITGAIASPTYIQMGNGNGTTNSAGRLWYDQVTGAWNAGMGGGTVTQRIGENTYIYGRASASILVGQLVMKTGVVSGSNIITFGPTLANLTDSTDIIGIAVENISFNGLGRVLCLGVAAGFNTTGSPYGETWVAGDDLWYSPLGGGNITKVKPSAPNIKTYLGEVVNPATSGSIAIRMIHGSTLGGTDSNVLFSGLADGQVVQYESATSLWKNKTVSTTNVTEGSNLYYTDTRARSAASGYYLPLSGGTLTGQLDVSSGGVKGKFLTTNWTVQETGGYLLFQYGGVNKMRLDSSGNLVVTGNVTGFGTI